MFIKKKLKYFTRPKQISLDLSGVSGDFRIVCLVLAVIEFIFIETISYMYHG